LREAEGRFVGPLFLGLLSFGGAKESNSPAGARPGKPAKPHKTQIYQNNLFKNLPKNS
jgi:hypothetical protein